MATLASPISSRPMRWCTARRASGQMSRASSMIRTSARTASGSYASYSRKRTARPWLWFRTRPANVATAPSPPVPCRQFVRQRASRFSRVRCHSRQGHSFKYSGLQKWSIGPCPRPSIGALRMAPAMYACACGTASSSRCPRARLRGHRSGERASGAVRAAPGDPFRPELREALSVVEQIDDVGPDGRWPPLMTTLAAPKATRRRAASRRDSASSIRMPVSASASGMFGVTTNACRSSSRLEGLDSVVVDETVAALGNHHRIDDEQCSARSLAAAATAATMAALGSMPVLAA